MPPRLLALEYVVDDLGPALELLVDLLGFEEVARGDHPGLDAEMVTLDIGGVALTLLHPTTVGDRPPVTGQACNLSQLVFESPEPVGEVAGRLAEAGAGVVIDSDSMFHLSQQTTDAVFGVAPAFLFTAET